MKGYEPPLTSPTVVLGLAVYKSINVRLLSTQEKIRQVLTRNTPNSFLFNLFLYVLIKSLFMKKRRMLSAVYLDTILLGPVWEKLWICFMQKASLPHLVIKNGAERRWTNFYPMQNIFPLLVWKHIWMPSSNGIAGVMWITIKSDIPERRSDINLHPLR